MDNPQNLTSLYGNPDQIFSPSIYSNILNSTSAQNLIRIDSGIGNTIILGLLLQPFKFNVNAEWDSAGILESITSNGMLGNLYDYAKMAWGASGIADPTNLGLSSMKIYKNSGYLEFDVAFRVIDWRGAGDPLTSAFVLSSLCLPTSQKSYNAAALLGATEDMALDTVGNVIKWLVKVAGKTESQAQEIASAFKSDASGIINGIGSFTSKMAEGVIKGLPKGVGAVTDLAKDPEFFVLASAPTPVRVKIGTYFSRTDLIVKSVSTELSKECTSSGPLYADFTMSFSSRRTMLKADENSSTTLGLVLSSGTPRVTRGELARNYK